ncbi:MAG: DUF5681 domain-containing protein [Stellaceae bacterium]
MAERDKTGRFRPGASGNPAGRSRGQALVQVQLRKELEKLAPTAIEHLARLVAKGNIIGLRLVLERVLPPPKSGPIAAPLQIDGMTPPEQAAHVVAAMAAGSITLEDALALMSALAGAQRINDSAELAERIREIEARLAALTGGSAPAQVGSPPAALAPPKVEK